MTSRRLEVKTESWPLKHEFRISRGAKTQADVIVVTLRQGEFEARGESVPYRRYHETIESVQAQILSVENDIQQGIDRGQLQQLLPPGAARNALDCAMWELEALEQSSSVNKLCDLVAFAGAETAQTISINSPDEMARSALEFVHYPIIKVKLDSLQVVERMQAVHSAAPSAKFIVDANEAWDLELLNDYADELQRLNVVLIEQPLPAQKDKELIFYKGKIPLCADESIHSTSDLEFVSGYYQFINIKLDKTGGLTEALRLLWAARQRKLGIMVGCMVGTSLAMAPAALLASYADFVDLDGPALLAKDRPYGFGYFNGMMSALDARLWGGLASI